MFFFLRMVFWLSLAIVFLPNGGAKQSAGPMAACARAGARMVYDFMRTAPDAPRSIADAGNKRAPAAKGSHGTLTASDLAPAWHGPRNEPPKRRGA